MDHIRKHTHTHTQKTGFCLTSFYIPQYPAHECLIHRMSEWMNEWFQGQFYPGESFSPLWSLFFSSPFVFSVLFSLTLGPKDPADKEERSCHCSHWFQGLDWGPRIQAPRLDLAGNSPKEDREALPSTPHPAWQWDPALTPSSHHLPGACNASTRTRDRKGTGGCCGCHTGSITGKSGPRSVSCRPLNAFGHQSRLSSRRMGSWECRRMERFWLQNSEQPCLSPQD